MPPIDAYVPEADRAVTCSRDGSLRVWDLDTYSCLKVIVAADGHELTFCRYVAPYIYASSSVPNISRYSLPAAHTIPNSFSVQKKVNSSRRWTVDGKKIDQTECPPTFMYDVIRPGLLAITSDQELHLLDLDMRATLFRYRGDSDVIFVTTKKDKLTLVLRGGTLVTLMLTL
jgi:WD40 repeat protein